jgi:hypothetical protein
LTRKTRTVLIFVMKKLVVVRAAFIVSIAFVFVGAWWLFSVIIETALGVGDAPAEMNGEKNQGRALINVRGLNCNKTVASMLKT